MTRTSDLLGTTILRAFFVVIATTAALATPARAQSPQAQPCADSRLATPAVAGAPACFVRDAPGNTSTCVVRFTAIRMGSPGPATANYLFRLIQAYPVENGCFMTSQAPDKELASLRTVDPVMAAGTNWSATRMIGPAAIQTFTNGAGKSCFTFLRAGAPLRTGYKNMVNGFYCEAPSAAAQLNDARIGQLVAAIHAKDD